MIIYKTTNTITGEFYVGQDSKNDPEYLGSGDNVTEAIEEYGKENFKKETIEVCGSKKDLNEREIYWIDKLDARNRNIGGYNISKGGTGGNLGSAVNKKISETRKKLGLAVGKNNPMYGKELTAEHKKKISESLKGNPLSESTKTKMPGRVPWNKGRVGVYSDEYKEKLSIAAKNRKSGGGMTGKKHSEKSKKKMSESSKGNAPWNKGRTGVYSAETRKKMSDSAKLRWVKKI